MFKPTAEGMYLRAAYLVLSGSERGMHYGQITTAALRLGYLKTDAKTPEITMSSQLSSDVANNRQSRFKKSRPGVYGLRNRSEREASELSDVWTELATRCELLRSLLDLQNNIAVVRRAIFMLRRVLSACDESRFVVIAGSLDEIAGNILEIGFPESLRSDNISAAGSLRLPRDLQRALDAETSLLGVATVADTLGVAIDLLAAATCVSSGTDKTVIVLGGLRELEFRVRN